MANTILAALKSGAPYIPGAVNGIARSINAGVSWALAYTAASPVMGVCNTTSTTAFAITYNGHLLTSTNTGTSWSDLGLINAGATTCTDIGYLGNNTLVVGNGAGAFISYNTGSSWSVLLSAPISINKVVDMGGGQALLMGTNGAGAGYVTKTVDYGANWTPIGTIGTFYTYDAVYAGGGVVLACGGTASPINQVYKSSDSGATWGLAYNAGLGYWGESIGWLPGTNYAFTTLQSTSVASTRPLYRSPDLGGSWVSLGNQKAVSLYGGSGSTLYSGRTTSLCGGGGGDVYAASIYVSLDLGGTWPRTATPYDPNRFLEISGAVAPVSDFSGNPLTGVEPLGVTFTDLSTNTPTSWLWNFGDGSTGADQNPYHTYTGMGSYTVDLTATNGTGSDTETKPDYILVLPLPPIVDFYGSPETGFQPLGVTFMDASTGLVDTRLWEFGDGSTGSDQDPYHTYTGAGSYTVSLTAGNTGGSDSETKADYITVYGPPTADFFGLPLTGLEPLGVTFTDLSTGMPVSWLWNFGDGVTGTDQNPYHTYTGAGSYTVSLDAINPGGSDTETKIDYIIVELDQPVADFYMNKTSGYTPLSVHFTDLSTSVSPIVSWLWAFGDGSTSTNQNPAHTYTMPGVYTVTLTVWNALGRFDTETKSRVLAVALGTPSLMTYDIAPPQGDEMLAHMADTGDASNNMYLVGIKYYIPMDQSSPDPSGFKRPMGPSIIFD
jgi:PKD repeat protein